MALLSLVPLAAIVLHPVVTQPSVQYYARSRHVSQPNMVLSSEELADTKASLVKSLLYSACLASPLTCPPPTNAFQIVRPQIDR